MTMFHKQSISQSFLPWLQSGVTRVALNENDSVIGFGCQIEQSPESAYRFIATLYTESYDIAQDILRSLCADTSKDNFITLELW